MPNRNLQKSSIEPQPVFLIATQRSGTNYLRSLLRGTGAFADFDEILHSEIDENNPPPHAYFDWSKFSYFKFRAEKIAANPSLSIPHVQNVKSLFDDYLAHLKSAAAHFPFYLMDVKYNSLHHFDPVWQSLTGPKYIFELIRMTECRVLHLVRENYFDVFLSEQTTRLTGTFVKTIGQELQIPAMTISIEDMLWNIRRIEKEVNLVRFDLEGLRNVVEVTYESITSSHGGMPGEISSKLNRLFSTNLVFKQVTSTQKIIPDRWSIVANATEVKEALLQSEYARFV